MLKSDFMADDAVINALADLQDSINKALATRGLPPLKAFAVIAKGKEVTSVARSGCDCIACKIQMLISYARANGAEFDIGDITPGLSAAERMH